MTEPDMRHVGWPISDEEIVRLVRAGKKPYCPTEPGMTDQRPYRAYLAKAKEVQP